MLMYDSSDEEGDNDLGAKFFEKVANRFSDANITTVVLAEYDTYAHSIPMDMEYTSNLPQLIFYPAFHKDPPYRYFQDIRTEQLMRSVQKSADIQFDLPENFHLSKQEKKRFDLGLPLEDL